MSKAGGVVLILGGLAVAGYVMAPDDEAGRFASAPQTEVARSARIDQPSSQDVAVPLPQAAFRPIASRSAPPAEPAFSTPVVVTVAPRPSDAATSPSRAAAIPKDRDALTRELQKELRRVGCYDGELNGAWTPATRRAMKAFTDRLNASLPVEEPDAVLFAMVQGQQDRVCGKPCPGGQGLSEDGRCVPNPILAKATKKASPAPVMAQAPTANPSPAANPGPAITGWSTTVTAAARVPAPTVAAGTPVPPPQAIASAPPLAPPPTEGRMALAGPTIEPTASDGASPRAVAAPPPAARPRAPKREAQGGGSSWVRSMIARRFESGN